MKILLVTGNYLPGKNGGIENYTHWLAKTLMQHHHDVEVAALNVNESESYFYEDIKVNNLKGSFLSFENVLRNGEFDICHFQEYSEFGGIEIPWFEKAREYSSKVFFTFHLPYLTCYKKDLRYRGIEDCNIFSNSKRCTECVVADRIGYKKVKGAQVYLSLALALMKMAGKKNELECKIISKYETLNKLIETSDQIFIYGKWFKRLLNENGYNSPKFLEIPHITKVTPEKSDTTANTIKKKLLFVGRIEHQKGLHLLCKAMHLIDTKDLTVDVFGNIVDENYYKRCRNIYNFNYQGSIPHSQLLEKFHDYDFLVLPSIFTEMFSLVLNEAFYERLPVIVSTAKGNKDVVEDGVNGFLFEYDDAGSLAKTIDKAYDLLRSGWIPTFKKPAEEAKDIKEIISYYRIRMN